MGLGPTGPAQCTRTLPSGSHDQSKARERVSKPIGLTRMRSYLTERAPRQVNFVWVPR